MFDLLLGVLSTIAEIAAAGGKEVSNTSELSEHDRQLGKDVQKCGQDFSNSINNLRNRLNDED